MRRIVVFLVLLMFVFGLTACGDATMNGDEAVTKAGNTAATTTASDGELERPEENTRVKLEGEITAASAFSEGLAFVSVNGQKDVTYCIDKQGGIVFTLNEKLSVNGKINACFINGLAYINGGLCDTKGKFTMPEDVGVTAFYTVALSEGYILAEVVTSDYAATKKEFGIMNTSFEWIVQPTEELHAALCSGYGSIALSTTVNSEDFCHNGVVYVANIERCLDLKTGTVTDDEAIVLPSSAWVYYTDKTLRDKKENVVLDLSQYENLVGYHNIEFVDGKAAVTFYNADAHTSFFTLINEEGNFLFEPVLFDVGTISSIAYDGEYILVTTGSSSTITAVCYDVNGTKLGSLSTDSLEYMSYSFAISDGVVYLRGNYNYTSKCYYYKPDFTLLF